MDSANTANIKEIVEQLDCGFGTSNEQLQLMQLLVGQ